MQTDENHVLIIGGRQDSYTSEETWQYNIDDWSLSKGPPLNVAREGHCCGKILINDRDLTKTRMYPERAQNVLQLCSGFSTERTFFILPLKKVRSCFSTERNFQDFIFSNTFWFLYRTFLIQKCMFLF